MTSYLNYYLCPLDGTEWVDLWSCKCNARCPACNHEIEPNCSREIYAPLAHGTAV